MARTDDTGCAHAIGGCGCYLILYAIAGLIGGFCVQYVVDFWAPRLVHHAVHLPFFVAFIGGFLIGPVSVTLAVITWIASFII